MSDQALHRGLLYLGRSVLSISAGIPKQRFGVRLTQSSARLR